MPRIYQKMAAHSEIRPRPTWCSRDDLTIVACGLMVGMALGAAAGLVEQGSCARAGHAYLATDGQDGADRRQETGAIVTAEEHLLQGGMGSNIARIVAEACPVPMRFIGLADVYVESADPYELLEKYQLTAKDIVTAAAEVYAANVK
jgi:transketolase